MIPRTPLDLNTWQMETPVVDSVPQREPREGATAPGACWENNGPYAPRRSGRHRGRTVSPDPLMLHTTIWLEHDRDACAHEEAIEQLRDQLSTMEANLETLRTRVGRVADLRDTQGLREGQRALIARLPTHPSVAPLHVRTLARRRQAHQM